MNRFLSKKFVAGVLAGIANMLVIFGAPENIQDSIPHILAIVDSATAVYFIVQGWIDKTK